VLRPAQTLPPPAPVAEYHLPEFDWKQVARVVVLPVNNESSYTRAGEEFRRALTAELQRLGCFEIVAPPPDDADCLAKAIHLHGRFDELAMLQIAHIFAADVVLHATITHYSPYPQPRLGVVVQAVSPLHAKVAASVDGLWDGTFAETAVRAKAYYRTGHAVRFPMISKAIVHPQGDAGEELALASPMLFQRFVAHELVERLVLPKAVAAAVPQQPAEVQPVDEPLPAPLTEGDERLISKAHNRINRKPGQKR